MTFVRNLPEFAYARPVRFVFSSWALFFLPYAAIQLFRSQRLNKPLTITTALVEWLVVLSQITDGVRRAEELMSR